MTLSKADQGRIEELLYADDPADVLAALVGMSAEQLHLFLYRYNWDDGFAIPRAVLQHPRCERGTALLIYWALGGAFVEEEAKGDHRVLLDEVRSRLLSGAMAELEIEYDPVADWGLNRLQVVKLERAGFPPELIRAASPR